MKITLNNAEIVTILVNYMQDKFPGKYTCELKTYTYDPVVIFETIEETIEETVPESAYQRGYLDGIGRECPHCKDYKAMYIKVRDELAAEQQITQRQTARIVDLQTHIENLEGVTNAL